MIRTKSERAAAKRSAPKKAPRPEDMPEDDVSGDGSDQPKRIILHMPADLTAWLDEEWHRRRLPSRAETIRRILSEARDGEGEGR